MDHTIPAVSRAVDVLDELSRRGAASIAELTAALAVPRSTVYRLLNTLEAASMVIRNPGGTYRLGPHLLRLARAVSLGADIVTIARPFLERLSAQHSVSAKMTILQDAEAVVVAVAESRQTYTVGTQVGRRFPLHAGAASKLLLAHMPPVDAAAILARPLPAYTATTITDAAALMQNLDAIRAQGFSEDRSEYVEGVHAVAAPVWDLSGRCVAALSTPYFAQTGTEEADVLRQAVIDTAYGLSQALGGVAPYIVPEAAPP